MGKDKRPPKKLKPVPRPLTNEEYVRKGEAFGPFKPRVVRTTTGLATVRRVMPSGAVHVQLNDGPYKNHLVLVDQKDTEDV